MSHTLSYFVDEFIRHLTYEKKYSAHTITAYTKDILAFIRHLEGCADISAWNEVQVLHIRSWIAELALVEQEASSIKRKKSSLQSFFKYMMRTGSIQANPVSLVPTPKLKKRLPKSLEQSAIDNIILRQHETGATDDWEERNMLLISSILFETGVRRAELCHLSEKDVDIHRKTLLVFGKGNKERLIPLHESTVNEIISYLQAKRSHFTDAEPGALFVTPQGKRIYVQYVYRLVKKFLDGMTHMEKKSPHVMRHTFATSLLNNGADISAIKDLLGHSSLAATQVYTHSNIEALKKEFRKAHPRS